MASSVIYVDNRPCERQLYPILRRLEGQKLVSTRREAIDAKSDRPRYRFYYRLTAEGRRVAREATAEQAQALRIPSTPRDSGVRRRIEDIERYGGGELRPLADVDLVVADGAVRSAADLRFYGGGEAVASRFTLLPKVGDEGLARQTRSDVVVGWVAHLLPSADRERYVAEWRDHIACEAENGGHPRRTLWSLVWRAVVPLALRGRTRRLCRWVSQAG